MLLIKIKPNFAVRYIIIHIWLRLYLNHVLTIVRIKLFVLLAPKWKLSMNTFIEKQNLISFIWNFFGRYTSVGAHIISNIFIRIHSRFRQAPIHRTVLCLAGVWKVQNEKSQKRTTKWEPQQWDILRITQLRIK